MCLKGKSAVEPENGSTLPNSLCKYFLFFLHSWSHFYKLPLQCECDICIPAECSAVNHSDIPPGDLDKQAETNDTQ